MSKIKLTGENSGYVEISAGQNAGNNTLEAPNSGTRLVAHEGTQDVVLGGNLTVNGVLTYEDVTNIDAVGVITARSGIHVTGGSVGIGTDNPQTKLDLLVGGSSGGINIHNNATGSAFYQLSTTANSYKVESIGNDLRIYDNTSTAERLRIESGGTLFSKSPSDATPNFKFISDDTNWHGYLNQTVHGGTISSILSCGGTWTVDGTTYDATKDFNGSFGTAALIVHNQYNSSATGGELVFVTKANGSTNTDGAVTERLRVDASGRMTTPNQPAFYAYRAGDPNQVSAGDQIFDTTKTNRGGHYSTSNGRFTAPVAGAYFFSAALQLYGGSTVGYMMSFRINGTDFHGSESSSNPVYDEIAGSHGMLYFSAVITLAANEYVTTWTNRTVRGMQSYFTGYLIG